MSHETAETQASTPFTPAPPDTASPPTHVIVDAKGYSGNGVGGEAPFNGLYDHEDVKLTPRTDVKASAKKGSTGFDISREGKKGGKVKAGLTQSEKGPGFTLGGSRKKGDTTRSFSVGADSDGPALSGERERDLGNGKTATTSVGYNAKKGELSGGYKRASGEGADARSTEISGSLSKDGGKLKVKKGVGDYSVSAGAGVKATYGKPTRLPDGRWTVTYDTTIDGNLGGGNKKVTASVEGSHSSGGMRVFSTKEEADRFAAGDHAALLNDPMSLRPGETLTRSDSGKVKAGAETDIGGVATVGGGASRSGSSSETITRVDEKTVEILIATGTGVGVNASGGAGPVSAGIGLDGGKQRDRKYRFDVSTPQGREALEQYRKTGMAPAKYLVGFGLSDSFTFSRSINLGVVGASTGGTTTERIEFDEHNRMEQSFTGTRTKGASLLGAGEHNATATLTSGPKGTDMTASVKSSDGKGSMEEIAEATGTKAKGMPGSGDPKSSGTWSVESHMDDAQLAEFCKRVAGNGPVVLAPLLSLRGDGETLQEELRKAKSASDIRRSIASFVDATGGKGMAWIRQIAGITDYDVKLENDENFTGALGRQQIEAQLAAHYDQVNAGKGNPEIIKQDLADMRARCAAMSDPKKYTDLPHEVRAHEVQRITRYIADLRYLSELAAPHK